MKKGLIYLIQIIAGMASMVAIIFLSHLLIPARGLEGFYLDLGLTRDAVIIVILAPLVSFPIFAAIFSLPPSWTHFEINRKFALYSLFSFYLGVLAVIGIVFFLIWLAFMSFGGVGFL